MKSTFSVIYYLKRQVVKKDGTVPVMGRITVDGSQTQFSCKLTVDPKLWDTKGGRVTAAPAVQKAREHVGAALPPQLFNAPFVPRPRSAREHAPRGVCRKNERARAQRRGQHTPARAFVISADDRSRPFSNFHIFPFSSL